MEGFRYVWIVWGVGEFVCVTSVTELEIELENESPRYIIYIKSTKVKLNSGPKVAAPPLVI